MLSFTELVHLQNVFQEPYDKSQTSLIMLPHANAKNCILLNPTLIMSVCLLPLFTSKTAPINIILLVDNNVS